MNPTQQRRAQILERLTMGRISTKQAAELLLVTPRQARRLKAAYAQEGMEAAVHGNSQKSPHNKTPAPLLERILELAGPSGKYHDADVSHMQELFVQHEDIQLGRSTLDRLLKKAGVRKPRRRGRGSHRSRRERMPQEGALVQIDGSPFEWLEERGPTLCLLGAIDDATSKVLHLLFRPTEDQAGYLMLFREVGLKYGLPMAYYHDRHTLLRSPKEATIEEQLARRAPESQLQRVLRELGVESIPAYSPQAKGRIERLWGTLQRRLTKEMRLANVGSIEAANAFLPAFIDRHNARFAKEPKDPELAWVPLSMEQDLHYYFSTSELRTLKNDRTLSYGGNILQLLPSPLSSSLVGQKVQVRICPEKQVRLYDAKGKALEYKVLPKPPVGIQRPPGSVNAEPPSVPKPSSRRRQTQWLFADLPSDPRYPSTLTLETPSLEKVGCFEGQSAPISSPPPR